MQLSSGGVRGANTRVGVASEFSVYVGNLDPETPLSDMEELLYELFLQAGPLSHVVVPYNSETGRHRGYGFVEFLHKESVMYAIKLLYGTNLCGRLLNVKTVTKQVEATPTSAPSTSTSVTATNSQNPFFNALSAQGDGSREAPPTSSPTSDAMLSTPTPNPHLLFASCTLAPPIPPPPSLFPSLPPPMPLSSPFPPPPLFSPPSNIDPSALPPPLPAFPPFFPPNFPPPPPLPSPSQPPLSSPPIPQMSSPPFVPPPVALFPPATPPQMALPATIEQGWSRLHESRLNAHDHPAWLREDVKERLSQYHLSELNHSFRHARNTRNGTELQTHPPNPFFENQYK